MIKNILKLSLSVVLLLGAPAMMIAEPMIEITEFVDLDPQGLSISIEGRVLHVSGAAGQTIQIYNVTGVCVMNARVDGDEKHYDLNLQKGCYIVKVGKVVRKISIR